MNQTTQPIKWELLRKHQMTTFSKLGMEKDMVSIFIEGKIRRLDSLEDSLKKKEHRKND